MIEKSLKKILNEFEDTYNPLTLFSRMKDFNIKTKDALEISRYYEDLFYTPLHDMLDYKVNHQKEYEKE